MSKIYSSTHKILFKVASSETICIPEGRKGNKDRWRRGEINGKHNEIEIGCKFAIHFESSWINLLITYFVNNSLNVSSSYRHIILKQNLSSKHIVEKKTKHNYTFIYKIFRLVLQLFFLNVCEDNCKRDFQEVNLSKWESVKTN